MFVVEFLVAFWETYHWLTMLITAPVWAALLLFLWRTGRDVKRKRAGWWIESEYIRDTIMYIVHYHEPGVRLRFSGDASRKGARNRMVVQIPDEAKWRDSAPAWAVERRSEILARLESRFDCEVDSEKKFWGF